MKKYLYSLLFIFILNANNILAQEAFSYQAVCRDSTGEVLRNQLVGISASIIQIENNLPPTYREEHTLSTNDYGVINLQIGEGFPQVGTFESIDWSQKSFLEINLDINGGSNYTLNTVSEILSVPKAIYSEKAGKIEGPRFGLLVNDFGAVGDGVTDDTDAFEAALDTAFVLGCKVFVPQGKYKITRTLVIKDGVSIIGEGSGSDPLETPYNGTLIWYFGKGYAFKINGHNTKVKDLVIRDKSEETAAGGILVLANNRLVESVFINEVLISGFTNGTGLKVNAKSGGGLYYSSFNNVRIRHGKIGIHIKQDDNSHVNSNTWNHCQITGGGYKYGMLVNGGNNNNINGLIIEPYSSTHGHLRVSKGQIYATEIRIEGNLQDETIPLIYFNRDTKNSFISGVYAGGLTLDKGNNFIDMKSGKAIHYKNSSFNEFRNAIFFSPDGNAVPDWEIQGDYSDLEILNPELTEMHNVLKFIVPAGGSVRLEPYALARPQVKDLPLYDQVNFGFHVKTGIPNFAHAFTNATTGWTRSTFHSGSDEWEFVGMNAEVDRNAQSIFALQLTNPSGSPQEIFISTPTLSFGNQLPTLDEKPLFSSGGQLNGLLIHSFAEAEIPGNGFIELSQNANYIEINGSSSIYRINYDISNRFPKGSVITLLFNQAGVGVTNSGYLNLKSGFTSVINSSITFISNGNGTWREVSRNN